MSDIPTTSRRSFLESLAAATVPTIAGCQASTTQTERDPQATPAAAAFDAVVDVPWLRDNLESVELLDVRDESAFTDGHVPGAHRLPNTEVLRDHYAETDAGYEASPAVIADIVAAAGITPADDVVVYGEGSNLWETYAIYTLEAIGHEGTVALLDGGYAFWMDAGGEVATGTPAAESADYEPDLDTAVIATRERVAENVDAEGAAVQIVDNRSPAEYYGTDTDARVSRHGHIPGAINVEFTQNLHENGLRLRSPAELETLWLDDAGFDPDVETISYCSTAVRGSVGWFVLTQLGFEAVRNYEGSWLDWGTLSAEDGYPYVSGEGTGTVVDTLA